MNTENLERLADSVHEKFDGFVARKAIEQKIEEMKKDDRVFEMTDEEVRLLKAFRQFKRLRSCGTFSWQILPDYGIVLPGDGSLIRDPQDVSSK